MAHIESVSRELQMVRFGTTDWELMQSTGDSITWVIDRCVETTMTYLPAPFKACDGPMTLDSLRDLLRTEIEKQEGGLLSADVLKVKGITVIKTIYKVRYRTGFSFTGAITLLCGASTYTINVVAPELGMTGVREAMVMAILMSQGVLKVDEETGRWLNFHADPYDPTVTGPCLRNLADSEDWDHFTPEHPLTRLRRILSHIVSTLDFDPQVIEHARETAEVAQEITPSRKESPKPRQKKKRQLTAADVVAIILGSWILVTVLGIAVITLIGQPSRPLAVISDSTFAESVGTAKKPLAVFMYRGTDKSSNDLMQELRHVNARKLFWQLDCCDLDTSPQLARDYKVYAPCVVIFLKGKPSAKVLLSDVPTPQSLTQEIESAIFAARRKQFPSRH